MRNVFVAIEVISVNKVSEQGGSRQAGVIEATLNAASADTKLSLPTQNTRVFHLSTLLTSQAMVTTRVTGKGSGIEAFPRRLPCGGD